MGLLLDTHAFLWFASGDKQLPLSLRQKIEDTTNPCFISIASFWEITIKKQIGKLKLEIPLRDLFLYAQTNDIEIMPITLEHLLFLSKLPTLHNDPFDRLIISQAQSEDLTIASIDKEFHNYKIKIIWK